MSSEKLLRTLLTGIYFAAFGISAICFMSYFCFLNGQRLFSTKDYHNAEHFFVFSTKLNPWNTEALFHLGRVYEIQKKWKEALDAYQEIKVKGLGDYRVDLSAFDVKSKLFPQKFSRLKQLLSLKNRYPNNRHIDYLLFLEERISKQKILHEEMKTKWKRQFGFSKEILKKEEFIGKYFYSDSEIKQGTLYGSGQVFGMLRIKENGSLIVKARGTSVKGVFPLMRVSLGDEELGYSYVFKEMKDYEFSFSKMKSGEVLVGIRFENDAVDELTGEDRNLWVESVLVR